MASPSRWKRKGMFFNSRTSHSSGSHSQESNHSNSNQGNNPGESHQGNNYHQYDKRHGNSRQNSSNNSERGNSKSKKGKFKPQRHHQYRHGNSDSSADSEYWKGKHRKRQTAADVNVAKSEGSTSAGQSPPQRSLGSSSNNQSGASTSSSNQSQVTHIPGFYFDPEKKKYFRLLPGHNNYNPLTNDGIQLKAAEENRVQMMQGHLGNPNKIQSKHDSVKAKLTHGTQLVQLHRERQQGHLTTQEFARNAHEQCIRLLPLTPTCEMKPFPDTYFNGEEGNITFLKMDQQQGRVLMVIQDAFLSRMWQGTVTCDDKKHGRLAISNWGTVNVLGTRSNKITNVEWATSDMNGDLQVLYSVSGGATSLAQVMKCSYQESSSNPRWVKEFVFGVELMKEMMWTCAWSHNPRLPAQFSIGGSRRAVIMDMATANRREIFSGHSDVLAQEYSLHQPVLYNGTRRGEILGSDLRTDCLRRNDLASEFKHRVSVCCIKLLKDDNYLLASDISGKVKLWDIRTSRWVQTYEGFANNHSQLPICVDSSENVIYGAGIDKSTKFWDIQDGRLLHTIPCPVPVRKEGIPTPAYSRQWYGGATPGMILGMERQLFWYSLTT